MVYDILNHTTVLQDVLLMLVILFDQTNTRRLQTALISTY